MDIIITGLGGISKNQSHTEINKKTVFQIIPFHTRRSFMQYQNIIMILCIGLVTFMPSQILVAAIPTPMVTPPSVQNTSQRTVSEPPSMMPANHDAISMSRGTVQSHSNIPSIQSSRNTASSPGSLSMTLKQRLEKDIQTYNIQLEGELNEVLKYLLEIKPCDVGRRKLSYMQASSLLEFLHESYQTKDPSLTEWEARMISTGIGYAPDVIKLTKNEASEWYQWMKYQETWDKRKGTFYKIMEYEVLDHFIGDADMFSDPNAFRVRSPPRKQGSQPIGFSADLTDEDEDFFDGGDSENNYAESSSEDSGSGSEDIEDEGVDEEVETDQQGVGADKDFDRLVQDIRNADNGASGGMLNKVWDLNLEEQEAEFKDDLREASGVGKRKKGKGKRGRRAGPVLSPQVRALLGDGNQAYADDDIPEAIRIMQEVIRVEPRAFAAWKVLASCYESPNIKDDQKALQLRIMGAHLTQDPDDWRELAEKSRTLGLHQQALYCYRKLYLADTSNTEALWDRALLAKEVGELRIARNSLLTLLRTHEHSLAVLQELRPILIELSELPLCATLYQGAFDFNRAKFPSGTGTMNGTQTDGGGFGLMEVLVLADLYNTLAEFEKAVQTIRIGCRWLQGRGKQVFWDSCEDDREYDLVEGLRGTEGEVDAGMYPLDINARHRLAIARIRMGDLSDGKLHAKIVLSQPVTEYGPLFGEIADAYFEKELYADAGQIYETLGGDTETSSLYVLLQAAACRRMVGDLKEAAEVYQHVIAADPTHNEAKMKLAEIYEIMNEPRKALDLVLQVIDSRKKRARHDTDSHASNEHPGTLFEEKARGKPVKTPKSSKLTAVQLRELEAQKEREVMQGYHRLKELWPGMLKEEEGAVREWLIESEKLVETFRETRNLFLTTRNQGFRGMFPRSARRHNDNENSEANEDSMASRLQLELGRDTIRKAKSDVGQSRAVDSFRTISFDDWLRLFMQYAFVLTKRGDFELAHEILRHVSYSNAFQSRNAQDTIRLAIITCAIAANKPEVSVEQSRKLINTHQFNNEPFRILMASLGNGLHATDAFLASTLSKHLLRELKSNDLALKNPDSLRWNNTIKRYGIVGSSVKGEDEDEEPDVGAGVNESGGISSTTPMAISPDQIKLPTKENPIGVAIYGQVCLAAKSYQSALFYLLHAYDYCPHDPMICLSLAIASIGRAMQRQADNRHHLVTQGMAFLSQYRALREDDDNNDSLADEVEYNFGRAFHQLGLLSLAVRHYERVLELTEKKNLERQHDERVSDDNEGVHTENLARDAAYNLSLIYVTTGATPLAEKLYRKWLSL
ncbi:Transcription factor Tfc4/TFIIIC-102/Sfc4 [Abortiporus biennis]